MRCSRVVGGVEGKGTIALSLDEAASPPTQDSRNLASSLLSTLPLLALSLTKVTQRTSIADHSILGMTHKCLVPIRH